MTPQPSVGMIEKRKEKMMGENKAKEFQGDDNCPICRAMEDGSANTIEGQMKAFEDAEKQGAVVGGKYFEKEKNQSKN